MIISARGLNRATLARQMLLCRAPVGVAEAIRRAVALQAQEPASPYIALWNRVSGFDPAGLDAAFAGGEVVKGTLIRITLHAVHASDYRAFREGMEPTLPAARLHDKRFTVSGLTVEDVHTLIPDLSEYTAEPRTAAAFESWLARRLDSIPDAGVFRMLRQYAPLLHVPGGSPWSFGTRPSYVAALSQPSLADPDMSAAGLQMLTHRYLEGFGPASVADIAQFALGYRPLFRTAFEAIAGSLEQLEGPDGKPVYDIPGTPRPPDDALAPPRLMAMWDSVLLAHADRGRIITPEYRKLVTRINGDVLPTLLVDGYVAGVWRAGEGGIEAKAFDRFGEDVWEGLEAEARSLWAFLAGREPRVYRRYDHWWSKLPAGEVRLLPV